MAIDILNACVYVGTYKKYNNGNLFGKWVSLADFSTAQDFINACRLLHYDEEDPELMFQDYENIPFQFITQNSISDYVFEVINNVPDYEIEAFTSYIDYAGSSDFFQDYKNFQECYNGSFDDEEVFAQHLIESCYDLDEFTKRYFNYQAFANDLFMFDYTICDGFVFSRF